MRSARRRAVYICTRLASRTRALAAGLTMICAVYTPGFLLGQTNWAYTSSTISAPAGTNVGIGGNPLLNLDVIGGSGQSYLFRVRSSYLAPIFVLQGDLSATYAGGTINFLTSQGSFTSPAAMGVNQMIGQSVFQGHDGSSYNTISSMIRHSVDGSVSTGVVPGRIQFYTAPSGAGGVREVMRLDSNGFLGLGTTSMGANLEVVGSSNTASTPLFRLRSDYSNPSFVFQNDNNTGYGGGVMIFKTSQGSFASPAVMSNNQVVGQLQFQGYDGSSYNTNSSMIRASVDGSVSTGVVPGRIQFYTAPLSGAGGLREVMRIGANGNVGIGTTSPQNTLSVNGIIQAKEVLVNTGWSDYVFAPNYRLRPLKEVKAYIENNHHLPEIPTEAEVKKHGVTLGAMQAKLLAKVEELTLHMIQADEQNNRLEQQNRQLQERIARLEAGTGAKRGN